MLLTTACVQSDTLDPRLRALRQSIASGGYVVDARDVASAMLACTELQLVPWVARSGDALTMRARSRPSDR